MGWSPSGKIIATGSNDKIIKLVRLDMERPEDDLNSTDANIIVRDNILILFSSRYGNWINTS